MDLKVLIADDDPDMRRILGRIIEQKNGVRVEAEAEDGKQALEFVLKISPQIVFLDIEMPVINGVECAKRIVDIDPRTYIIFATAHDEYMKEAFEVYAFDYIIKPFGIKRVHETLDRILQLSQGHYAPVILERKVQKVQDKILVKNKESVSLVDTKSIIIISRENNTTVIHTDKEDHITNESLSSLEEKLDHDRFLRSHKSYIINIDKIIRIYPYGRWTHLVKFSDTDKDALITHEKNELLQKYFE
jgi:two-component system LytT family response regulator